MSGFNRRYAPMYEALVHQPDRRLVILQKHRSRLVDIARRVVFDDFIHVVDTLRFLAPGPIDAVKVNGAIRNGALHHVLVQLDGEGFSLLGAMNRDSGITEETLEVMSPDNRWRVQALSQTTHAHGGVERVRSAGDWDTVLWRRGFPQIVQHFLDCVRTDGATHPSAQDSLATHLLCERIVTDLEAAGATAMAHP
jgi:virulence factor